MHSVFSVSIPNENVAKDGNVLIKNPLKMTVGSIKQELKICIWKRINFYYIITKIALRDNISKGKYCLFPFTILRADKTILCW